MAVRRALFTSGVQYHKVQCSVRGYSSYTADLEDKVDEHEICYHAYADDTQLYLRCRCEVSASAVGRLEHVIIIINQSFL